MTYTIKYAEQWGIGGGVNGYGKREKVFGYYVIDQAGKRVRAFTAKKADLPKAEKDAQEWAAHLNEQKLRNWDLLAICKEVDEGLMSARYASKMLGITIDDLSDIMVKNGYELDI